MIQTSSTPRSCIFSSFDAANINAIIPTMALKEGFQTAREYYKFLKERREALRGPRVYRCENLQQLTEAATSNDVTTISVMPEILRTGFDVYTQERQYTYRVALAAEVWEKVRLSFHSEPVNVLKGVYKYVIPGIHRFSVNKEESDLIGWRAWAGVPEDEEKLPDRQRLARTQAVKAAEQQLEILQSQLPGVKNRGVQSSYFDMTLREIGGLDDREVLETWIMNSKWFK